MKRMISVFCGAFASLGVAQGAADFPLIVYRQTGTPTDDRAFFEQTIKVHERYRGAIDEFWMSSGAPLCNLTTVEQSLRQCAVLRPLCESVDIDFSYQQGLTLGHGYRYVGKPGVIAPAGVYPFDKVEKFPDDAWRIDVNGKKKEYDQLCPRSPAVLDYAYRYVRAVVAALKPPTYWLDDDLRMGVMGSGGCFCPRCLRQFNEQHQTAFDREELVRRLFQGSSNDVVRTHWMNFCSDSLVGYARAARRGANEVMPECRLCLQTVRSETLLNGRDYEPVLKALSDNGRVPSGLRPGDGYYNESQGLNALLAKNLLVMREAERCRLIDPKFCGTVCYEEETYPRRVIHKSPAAIIVESALAIAAGCDTISLYFADGERPQSIADYERFVKTVAESRPYLKRLAAVTRRTSLGGLAHYVGSRISERPGFTLNCPLDLQLMKCGIPVTSSEATSANKVWYFPSDVEQATTPEELKRVKGESWVKIPFGDDLPTITERAKLLDELDRVTKGRFPVRIDLAQHLCVYPRIDAAGKTVAVTLFNLSYGETGEFVLKIRNPASRVPFLDSPRQRERIEPTFNYDDSHDELKVTLNLPASGLTTVFF